MKYTLFKNIVFGIKLWIYFSVHMKKSTNSRPTVKSQGSSTSVSDKKQYTKKKLFIIKYIGIDFKLKTILCEIFLYKYKENLHVIKNNFFNFLPNKLKF